MWPTTAEWITIAAIIVGPLAAVFITEGREARRRRFEARLQILRMLLNTRGLPADPSWFIAINSVPVEFHAEAAVMAAWREYVQAVRYGASPGNEDAHNRNVVAKQTTLIFSIAKQLGYNITENDIQNEAYYSCGFVERDQRLVQSWEALVRIAYCQEQVLNHIRGVQPPPPKPGSLA